MLGVAWLNPENNHGNIFVQKTVIKTNIISLLWKYILHIFSMFYINKKKTLDTTNFIKFIKQDTAIDSGITQYPRTVCLYIV